MKGIRLERMKKEIFKLVSTAYSFSANDDRLHSLRITNVKLTPDLQNLKISYDFIDSDVSRKQMQELIEKSSGFIKKQIAGAHIMRRIPEISFQYDTTEDKANELNRIFQSLEAEKRKNGYDDEDDDYEDPDMIDDDFEDEYEDYDDDDYDDFDDDFDDEIIDDEDEDY
jgi:ribosome-binding factor A